MDGQDPQCWMELWYASLEVMRRRLAESDGEVGLSVLESISLSGTTATKAAKLNAAWISPRHVRVIPDYAAGKHLAKIAREEKTSRRTFLRI